MMKIQVFNWQLSVERVFFEEDRLAGMYNEAASRWSRSIDRMGYLHAYDRLFARLCTEGTLMAFPKGGAVLDAGIGTGELTAALAHHRPDASWHGIDISDNMLKQAAQRLNVNGDFRQANLANLCYEDNTFDLVISAHTLEHMPNPEIGVRELLRVLKPGQPFVIVATRLCPITSVLSLRWNFRPMRTDFVLRELTDAGGTNLNVKSLMPQSNLAYMSLVYSGIKIKSR